MNIYEVQSLYMSYDVFYVGSRRASKHLVQQLYEYVAL